MLLGLLFKKKNIPSADVEIISAIKGGNNDMIGLLFEKYHLLVLGICLKYLKNKEEAEDLQMIIFDKLSDKILQHDITNFKSWLYTFSKNECLMLLRKKNATTISIDDIKTGIAEDDLSSSEIKKLHDEKLEYLLDTIKNLNSQQQKCIELFFMKNKSYDEIVAMTNYSKNDVKSYIQNGKRNLKLLLEKNPIYRA